ncbi:propane monooxygenase small subunit [Haloechinothrix alba]|uniref:propane 2-monooxygenase n=1 Tax=Haloechinothrix alba TaxID=664784 RepID=A0A238VKV7_9PSEU|nr:toluene hydroxylase [Haloechinothrix alba]SNR34821.1 propane monooxygenase small subunit [Haloechinothrix alba]
MTTLEPTPAPQQRSVPKLSFTDAEAGAKTFPGSESRFFEYYKPKGRKRTHYEDVTIDVQPDPRHYLSQGWLYSFADGQAGYPLEWTVLKAWGEDTNTPPKRYAASGGQATADKVGWPATGWHEFRDPNEEWEQTIYRYNANVVRQMTQNIDNARETKAFAQWNPSWVRFVERHASAWMHPEHGLGLYVFVDANRAAPTNMHNNAISVNGMHRIRFAQDIAMYNMTLANEIEGFDGTAHREAWYQDPVWQGVREVAEHLTAISDWAEEVFCTNIVFEPLVGELFRTQLVMHSAPGNGDYVTPTVFSAGEYDYAQRDLRYTRAMFSLLTEDKEFAEHNKSIMQGWLSTWVPRCLDAARQLQPLWSQPEAKPPRFEDSLDAVKERFAGICRDLNLQPSKELGQ